MKNQIEKFKVAILFEIPKRIIDIVGSIVFMIVFSPVYIITAILIWNQDKHSPFYTQIRVGKNQKHFITYKFRSMVVNADQILFNDKKLYEQMRSGNNKVKEDPRITKLGHFIRKYSIDEFLQMFNVLKGEMSIVGPRPLRPDEYELSAKKSENYKQKLALITTVKPGLTGLWQVSGRSNIDFDHRLILECEYAKKKSLLMDIIIMLKTPYTMLKGEGAY